MKNLTDKTFLKFAAVGVVNTLVGTAVMFILYNVFSCSYWVSSAANYIVGSVVSYFLNKYYTFRYQEKSWKVVFRFIVNIAVCYMIAYGIAKPLISAVLAGFSESVRDNGAMAAGAILFVVLNYFGQRFFAFRKAEA